MLHRSSYYIDLNQLREIRVTKTVFAYKSIGKIRLKNELPGDD